MIALPPGPDNPLVSGVGQIQQAEALVIVPPPGIWH